MPLDTTKSVKSITYNGANIPLYSKPEQTKTVDLSMASGNQVISPDSGKVLSKVTVNKPSTLIPDNIKKDVNIGGVVGTLESGTSSKIQPSKNLTITSNGTTTITPDVPYDAMGQVGVTVNVASGGASGETTQLQVYTDTSNTPSALFCLWQTSNGWTVTSNFDTTTDFTIPNVTVGGYVIFTREPESTLSFSVAPPIIGVQRIDVDVMDAETDTLGGGAGYEGHRIITRICPRPA